MYACTTFLRCLLKSPIMRMFLFSSILRIQYTIQLKFSMEYFADDVLLGARTLKSGELALHQSLIQKQNVFNQRFHKFIRAMVLYHLQAPSNYRVLSLVSGYIPSVTLIFVYLCVSTRDKCQLVSRSINFRPLLVPLFFCTCCSCAYSSSLEPAGLLKLSLVCIYLFLYSWLFLRFQLVLLLQVPLRGNTRTPL